MAAATRTPGASPSTATTTSLTVQDRLRLRRPGRNTGVAVDPSGNVWLANNWKRVPIQTNPGGYQIVACLGLAAPVKTPIFGPPERP